MIRRLAIIAAFAIFLVPEGAQADSRFDLVQPDSLTVCLPRNGGVIAGRRLTGGSGFDYQLSVELANRLDLGLEILWIENDLDEESDPIRETYALLAHGLCDAVPGHPRYESSVGEPDFKRASLPRWLNMPQEIDPETGLLKDRLAGFVDVQSVDVSQGYMRSEIGLVYRDGDGAPTGIDDLGDRKLALQQGTLSGAIATLQIAPIDRQKLVMMNPGAGFLWEVENQKLDLAIVDVAAFDAHLKSNPFTPLQLAEWRHAVGMDIGIATLTTNAALLQALNAALADILAEGLLPAIAEAEGMTYAKPRSDELTPKFTLSSLRAAR